MPMKKYLDYVNELDNLIDGYNHIYAQLDLNDNVSNLTAYKIAIKEKKQEIREFLGMENRENE